MWPWLFIGLIAGIFIGVALMCLLFMASPPKSPPPLARADLEKMQRRLDPAPDSPSPSPKPGGPPDVPLL